MDLVTEMVDIYTPQDGILLDSYAGNLSTAIACMNNDRLCISIEKDDRCFLEVLERLRENGHRETRDNTRWCERRWYFNEPFARLTSETDSDLIRPPFIGSDLKDTTSIPTTSPSDQATFPLSQVVAGRTMGRREESMQVLLQELVD